jgi:hypothetical protein
MGGGQTVKRRGISHKPEIKERSPIYIVSPWHIVTVNTTMIPWQAHECKNNLQNLFLISAKFVVFDPVKPSGNYVYHPLYHSGTAYFAFMFCEYRCKQRSLP